MPTPTKKYPACQPRQLKIKLTQPGRICAYKINTPFVQKTFLASNTDLPRFYYLIKTHKASPDIKIRPIVSNINGPTQRISWLLANALKLMLKNVPAHLQNRTHYMYSGWQSYNKQSVTLSMQPDVVSLYTTIPIQEAITNVRQNPKPSTPSL